MVVTHKCIKLRNTPSNGAFGSVVGLDCLAKFLNYNFDNTPKTWRTPDNPLYLLHPRPTQPDWNQVNQIQNEIRQDILSLIASEDHGDLYSSIETVVEKVNRLKMVGAWDVLPVDKNWVSRYGGSRWFNWTELPPPVRPFDKDIKIGGFKWRLRKTPLADSIRTKLYQIIIEAIETQALPNFKVCEVCSKFFIAAEPRDNTCSRKCKRIRDSKAAKSRMRNLRKKRREGNRETGVSKLREIAGVVHANAILKSVDLIQISHLKGLRVHLGDLWGEFYSKLGDLRPKNPNIHAIWNDLSPRLQNKLANAP